MRRFRSRAIVALLVALSAGSVSACGSSSSSGSVPSSSSASSASLSSSSSSSSPGSLSSSASSSGSTSTAPGRSPHATVPVARRLERALSRTRATPPVATASCRLETAAQRATSPFGPTGPPVYACTLGRGGHQASYDVQLLATGCFVAERRAPGVAIYGCGGPSGPR